MRRSSRRTSAASKNRGRHEPTTIAATQTIGSNTTVQSIRPWSLHRRALHGAGACQGLAVLHRPHLRPHRTPRTSHGPNRRRAREDPHPGICRGGVHGQANCEGEAAHQPQHPPRSTSPGLATPRTATGWHTPRARTCLSAERLTPPRRKRGVRSFPPPIGRETGLPPKQKKSQPGSDWDSENERTGLSVKKDNAPNGGPS